MELMQIRYFLTLAQTLNFTRAAEQCNVTQPALTKSIQRLEGELGGPLLLRERSHTQLTGLGAAMLPMLRQIADAADMARQGARQFRRQDRAQLRLGLTPEVEPSVIVPLFQQVRRHFPLVEFSLHDGDLARLNECLLGSEVDVILTADVARLTERANRWPVFSDETVALIRDDCDLAGSDPLSAGDLAGRDVIGRLDEAGRGGEIHHGLGDAIRHRGMSDPHVRAMVQAGAGIGLSTARRPSTQGLAWRSLHPPHAIDVFVAAIAGRPMSRAADAFLRLARARDWNLA